MKAARTYQLATIGYQLATVRTFLQALKDHRIDLLADVRAVASSRRAGFSKSALTANLRGAGIEALASIVPLRVTHLALEEAA